MKRPRLSLKQRIALSFILLAVTVAGAFSLVSYVAVEVIENQVFDRHLSEMADRLMTLHGQGHATETPLDIHFLVDADIPQELRQLSPGLHELQLDGRDVHALLRQRDGNLYAVVQELDDFEQTELVTFLSLAAGFVASTLLAAVLGLITARRIIAPVSALADAVSRNAPSSELPALSAQDEIGVLARAFDTRTTELQRFLQRERLFTGDVSHELRTPLTIMLGASEVLVTQLSDRPAQLAGAERIRRVAAETAQRVSALLLLSRAPESMDAPRTLLNAVIESELERYQPLLSDKPVRSRLACSEPVYADVRPELAGIMIGNLLRNACQHTEHGEVRVQLAPGRLIIEDTGPGIPLAVRERLFERFVRDAHPSHEGTGLGLSIVKRVAEHIGWNIVLESPSTGGSRFVLDFPVSSDPGEA